MNKAQHSHLRHAADMVLGAFLLPKAEATESAIPTTASVYLELVSESHNTQHLAQREAAAKACIGANVFHWPLAFPQIFTKGGFDCVLGNPPWEIVQARDALVDEELLSRQKQWYSQGIYEILSGRRDLYKLFLVLIKNILNPRGFSGLVTPIGFMFEDDSIELRKELFDSGSMIALLHLQNAKKHFFPDVHASYRFLALTVSPAIVDSHKFSAVITSSSQLDSPPIINVPRSRFDEVLGEERRAILFNDFEQAELHQEVSRKLASFPQLMYRIVAEFHASSDKPILNTRKESEVDFGLLKNGSFHHYYPAFGPVEKWVNRTEVIAKIEKKGLDPELWIEMPRLVFRDIARNDDTRTMIPCLVPHGFVSTYDAPMIVPQSDNQKKTINLAFYAGYLSSFLADFLIRPYVDKHIKGYVLSRVPIPNFDCSNNLMANAAALSLRLAQESWASCEMVKVPDASNRHSQDRIMLEALFFSIGGVTRDEIIRVLDHFSSVKNDDLKSYGEYRTLNLILAAWDTLHQEKGSQAHDSNRIAHQQKEVIHSAALADGAWLRPGLDQRAETGVQLIALLKSANASLPIRQLRLAATLAMEPRLILPLLDKFKASEWQRLIGDEARALPNNVLTFATRSNQEWGAAVRNLRTNGYLVENLQDHTWEPGQNAHDFVTPEWADGRANWVLEIVQRVDTETLLTQLPEEAREWINAAA